MKKIFFSFLCVAAFTLTGYSQIGFKAGVNFANQTTESGGISFSPSAITSLVLGVNYNAAISESLALRPGLSYSTKGSKIEFLGIESKGTFNYLEIPVDLVFGSGNFTFHGGPYIGMLLSASDSDGNDISEESKSTDFGLNLGVQYSFSQIGVGAQYGFGISNIAEDDPTIMDEFKVTNRVLSIYLTYTL